MKTRQDYDKCIGINPNIFTGKNKTRQDKINYALVGVMVGLLIVLADLVAQDLASKYYPIPEIPKIEQVEKELTIQEHICKATNGQNCEVLYNLCMAESNCEMYAVNKNTNATFDYSWYQINDVHIIGKRASKGQGTISQACVYDLYCASRWANEKIKAGQGNIWVAWHKI